jgi:2-methylcitrate dehydratase PrpD
VTHGLADIFGALTADHYEDATAAAPRIDALRAKMLVREDPRYTHEYLEPDRRSIANAVQIFFRDGSTAEKVEVARPCGRSEPPRAMGSLHPGLC